MFVSEAVISHHIHIRQAELMPAIYFPNTASVVVRQRERQDAMRNNYFRCCRTPNPLVRDAHSLFDKCAKCEAERRPNHPLVRLLMCRSIMGHKHIAHLILQGISSFSWSHHALFSRWVCVWWMRELLGQDADVGRCAVYVCVCGHGKHRPH